MKKKFEDILSVVGEFGPWQWSLLAATILAGISFDFHNMGYMLHSAAPDHWCAVPKLRDANWTTQQIKNISIPMEDRNGKWLHSRCYMYYHNFTELASYTYEEAIVKVRNEERRVPCDSWEYDTSVFRTTTVMEWDLVCERTALRPTIQVTYMAGVFIGSLVFGPVADRFGRRKAIMPSVLLVMLGSVCATFSPVYELFLIAVLITGMGTMGVFAACHVFIVELAGVQWRGLTSMLFDLGPPTGGMIWAIVGNYIRDWRTLYYPGLAIACVMLLYYWILPESPRWLLVKGRVEEATVVLTQAARRNGRKHSIDSQQLAAMIEGMKEHEPSKRGAGEEGGEEEEEPQKKKGWSWRQVLVLWRTPEMRSRSLKMFFTWLCIASASYGIPFIATRLPINIYLFKFLAGLQTFLVRLAIIAPLARFGRRWIYASCFLLLSASFAAFIFVPGDIPWLGASILIVCNVFVAVNFALVYLYTSELFPTEVRSGAVNVGSLHSRIGGMMAPVVVDYLGEQYQLLPGVFFAVISGAAGIVSLLLPETKNERLHETVADVEKWREARDASNSKEDATHL